MKLSAFTLTVLLGTLALAPAQTKPALQPTPKAVAEKNPNLNADGGVTLSAGSLSDLVTEIEQRISYWSPKPGGDKWVMPNILFDKNTREAVVPGDLTLRGVTPVQAVALVTAAAGCRLEPVLAPKEASGSNDDREKIIGYRIVLGGTSGPGWANGPQPAAKPYGFTPNQVQQIPTRSLRNPDLLIQSTTTAGSALANPPRPTEESNRPFVRVYGLGSSRGASEDELAKQQKYLADLTKLAIDKAEAGTTTLPELSFHSESRALIVKATAVQHEIIDQVIKAMKENQPQPSAPSKP